jgi:hypothetical protein
MKKFLLINGVEYPLSFGNNFKRRLESEHNISLMKMRDALKNAPINTLTSMCFIALQDGSRIAGSIFPYDIAEFCDISDKEENLLVNFTTAFGEAMSENKKN